jgi:poly(ADP-ribose) glycohydrolase
MSNTLNIINIYFQQSNKYNYNILKFFIDNELSKDSSIKFTDKILPYLKSLTDTSQNILDLNENKNINLTRLEILIIIANSFLCKFKNDNHEYGFKNFYFLFHKDEIESKKYLSYKDYLKDISTNYINDPDEIFNLSIEKLKFIYSYFNFMFDNRNNSVFLQNIVIYKRIKENIILKSEDNNLADISFIYKNIEDTNPEFYKVNFANKYIGGKVLTTGCCQEEIKFLTNPELLIALIIFKPLNNNEVITIQNSIRYSNYSGYGFDLKFNGSIDISKELITENILEIDATRYTEKNKNEQYNYKDILREIKKVILGFKSCNSDTITTGNWGCGAFLGDRKLKFLIQLYAATVTKKKLIYCVNDTYLSNIYKNINYSQSELLKSIINSRN